MTDVEIQAVWRRIGGKSAYMRSAPKRVVMMTAKEQPTMPISAPTLSTRIQSDTREKPVIITDHQQWLESVRNAYCAEFDDEFGPEFEQIDATEQIQMEWSYRR